MYEDMTYDLIMERMLETIPDYVDKREGSITWDALAPAAVELQQIYLSMDALLQETFADTASKEFLIKRSAERGLHLKEATHAVLKGVFNINVPINSRFTLDDTFYKVTEQISDCIFRLMCETAGAEGNKKFGKIIPLEYLDRLTSAELTELLIPGEEEETEEELREKYFKSVSASSFGGNLADYKKWVGSIQGVGGTKLYPVWQGGGTVGVVISTSEFKSPSEALISLVQESLDPADRQGEGVGLAPIGHKVTVRGVESVNVEVETALTYLPGWDYEKVKESVENAIEEYFVALRKSWDSEVMLIIRISQIESRLLNLQGVMDIHTTKINESVENLVLDKDAIPVRGDVIVK